MQSLINGFYCLHAPVEKGDSPLWGLKCICRACSLTYVVDTVIFFISCRLTFMKYHTIPEISQTRIIPLSQKTKQLQLFLSTLAAISLSSNSDSILHHMNGVFH